MNKPQAESRKLRIIHGIDQQEDNFHRPEDFIFERYEFTR